MQLTSTSFEHNQPIPSRCAFGKIHPVNHMELAANRNPHLAWDEVPGGTRSFAIACVDPDVPSVGDDVNQEGRTISADLARVDFYHWTLVDLALEHRVIAEGEISQGVTSGGKPDVQGPPGTRQGVNDYTGFMAGGPMAGTYRGYDGPCPPWNDELLHHYHFTVYALDVERLALPDDFGGADFAKAISGHVLDQATLTGTYTLNPRVRG